MKKYWIAIAFVLLLIAAGIGVYILMDDDVSEILINTYDVFTDGLKSGETKTVYTDITTKTSIESKTDRVGGFVIAQQEPMSEEMKSLDSRTYGALPLPIEAEIPKGINYRCNSEYKMDNNLGFEVHDKSFFEKYNGNELIWQAAFDEFEFYNYVNVEGGSIVYGDTPTWSSEQKDYAWIAMIDDDGNILWKCQMDNGFDDEYVEAIVDNGDGTYAVFSRGDYEYFCLSQYNKEGNRISFNKTKVDNYGIWNAARSDDGYIVQLGNYIANEQAKIIKTDRTGNTTLTLSYESNDAYWYITDMIEFEGKMYLSAYTVPKCPDNETAGGRYEIANILNRIGTGNWTNMGEELTSSVRDNYTAMLLICDSDTGTPEKFYSVNGSLGGEIVIDDSGKLTWDVESITATYFSPATSSFSIGGLCDVFRYTFDENGVLLAHEKTDEVTSYRR